MKKRTYTKAIGIMVSEEMHQNIVHLCDIQELAISEFIREAIEIKLAQESDKDDNIITDE